MLNSFQHLTASLYLPPSLGEILKQVQDDFGRFLLFLHSFWGSQFNTYVKSKNSRLMAHLRAIIHICQKTRKVGFGVSEQKRKLYTYLYSNKIQNTKMMI